MKNITFLILTLLVQITTAQSPDECLVIMKNLCSHIQCEVIHDSIIQPKEDSIENHKAIVYFDKGEIKEFMTNIEKITQPKMGAISGERRGEWMLCHILGNDYGQKLSIYFNDIEEEPTFYNKRKIQLREYLLSTVKNFDEKAEYYIYDIAIPVTTSKEEARNKFKNQQKNLYNLGWSILRFARPSYHKGHFTLFEEYTPTQLYQSTVGVKVTIMLGLEDMNYTSYNWAEIELNRRLKYFLEEVKAAAIDSLKIEGGKIKQRKGYLDYRFTFHLPLDTDLTELLKIVKQHPYVSNYSIESKPSIYFLQYISKESSLEKVKQELMSSFDFIIEVSPCSFIED